MLIYKIKKFHPADAYYTIDNIVGSLVVKDPSDKGKHKASDFRFYRKGRFIEVKPDGTLEDFSMYFRAVQLIPTERIYNHGKV